MRIWYSARIGTIRVILYNSILSILMMPAASYIAGNKRKSN